MLFLGSTMLWLGYATAYYGLTQVQGGNWGFLDLALPSRWPAAANIPRDGAGVGSPTIAGATDVNVKAIAAAVRAGEKKNATAAQKAKAQTAVTKGAHQLASVTDTSAIIPNLTRGAWNLTHILERLGKLGATGRLGL